MIVELRIVKDDGTLGEYLPDYQNISYLDSATDVGQITIVYPQEGKRYNYLAARQEYAIQIDGVEPDNGRFMLLETDENMVSDPGETVKWTGPTLLNRLDEALVPPKPGSESTPTARVTGARVITPEEQAYTDELYDENAPITSEGVALQDETWSLDAEPAARTSARTGGGKKKNKKGKKDKKPKPPTPPKFEDDTPGDVMKWLINQAKDRGGLQEIKIGFDGGKDSAGKNWKEKVTNTWDVGTTLLEVASWLTDNDKAEFRMVGRTLNAYNATTDDPGTGDANLIYGKNITDGPRQGSAKQLASAVFVLSDQGPHAWVTTQDAINNFGRVEHKLDVQGFKDLGKTKDEATKYINRNGRVRYQYAYGVIPGQGADPYKAYKVGDWVNVHLGEAVDRRRVREVAIDVDADRNIKCVVTANDVIMEKEISNARITAQIQGKTASTSLSTRIALTSTEQSDGISPYPPSNPRITTQAGTARIAYDGLDEDGDDAVWDQVGVEVHLASVDDFVPTDDTLIDTIQTTGSIALTAADVADVIAIGDPALRDIVDPYSTTVYAKFIAYDRGGDLSTPSPAVPIAIPKVLAEDVGPGIGDVIAPTVSPTPVIYGGPGAAVVAWDPEPTDVYDVYVAPADPDGTAPDAAPDSTTLHPEGVGVLPAAWIRTLANGTPLPVGTDVYFAIWARNSGGSAPAPSEWVPGHATTIDPQYLVLTVGTLLANNLFAEAASLVNLYVSGDFEANTMTAIGKAAFRANNNELGPGAKLIMQGGTTAPATPPQMVIDVPYVDVTSAEGTTYCGGHVDGGYLYSTNSSAVAGAQAVIRTPLTGGATEKVGPLTTYGISGAVKIGTSWFWLRYKPETSQYVIDQWDASWNFVANLVTLNGAGTTYTNGVLGTDGTNLVMVYKSGSATGQIKITRFSPTGTNLGTTSFTNTDTTQFKVGSGNYLRNMMAGNADYGSQRYAMYITGVGIRVFDFSGVRQPGEEWHVATEATYYNGFAWDPVASQFVHLDLSLKRLYKFTHDMWDDGLMESDRYVSSTWVNPANEETDDGPNGYYRAYKRWRTQITAPQVPEGSSGFRAYMAQMPSSTADTSTDTITTSILHNLSVGDQLTFDAVGSTNLKTNTPYWVQSTPTVATFKVSATNGGAALNITGTTSAVRYQPTRLNLWRVGELLDGTRTIYATDPPVFTSPSVHPPATNGYAASTPSEIDASNGGLLIKSNSDGSVGTAGFRDSVRRAGYSPTLAHRCVLTKSSGGATQNVPGGNTDTVVTWDTATVDNHVDDPDGTTYSAMADLTNEKITIRRSGLYNLSAGLQWNGAMNKAGRGYSMAIVASISGTTISVAVDPRIGQTTANNRQNQNYANKTVYLSAGDTVWLEVLHNDRNTADTADVSWLLDNVYNSSNNPGTFLEVVEVR